MKCLIYADDVVLVAESREALQMIINRLSEYCEEHELSINEGKTKIVVFGQKGRPPREEWYIRRKRIEKVNEIKFLGVIFQANGSFSKHIKERSSKCTSAIGAMSRIINNKQVSTRTKIKIYEATVKSIMMYGAEAYGDGDSNEIDKVERYFYRWLYELPKGTPKYFVTTELGLLKLSAKTTKRWSAYRRKVDGMREDRIPKIVQKVLTWTC